MENLLIKLLGKLLDKSKAKNPLVWFIVACGIALAQVVVTNAGVWNISLSEEWLKALQTIITVGGLLIGSRTTSFLLKNGAEAETSEPSAPKENSFELLTSSDEPPRESSALLPPSLELTPRRGRPRKV